MSEPIRNGNTRSTQNEPSHSDTGRNAVEADGEFHLAEPEATPPPSPTPTERRSRRSLPPSSNKFHQGNGSDGKHYWLTPPDLMARLDAEFHFDFDPCPHPKPAGFDGLVCEWGRSNYANIPFGAIMHDGRKKGATAWVRKAIAEHEKGKQVVLVYPVDKWLLMLVQAGAEIRNLGDVRWLATEDGSEGGGTGRHIACFILRGAA